MHIAVRQILLCHLDATMKLENEEVMFQRFIYRCEQITQGDTKGRKDLIQWQSSPVFHYVRHIVAYFIFKLLILVISLQYVDALQEQLADLEDSGTVAPAMAQQYRQRLRSLSSKLEKPHIEPYCILPLKPELQNIRLAAATATEKQATHRAPINVIPPPVELSGSAQQKLKEQANLQDNIAEDLLGLTQALKSNTLAMEGKLRERGDLLESTEDALDKSVVGARESAAKAGKIHKRGRLNLCFTCLVMLAIGASFAGLFMFIRVTRFVGYKKAVPIPLPSPSEVQTLTDDQSYYYYYNDDDDDDDKESEL